MIIVSSLGLSKYEQENEGSRYKGCSPRWLPPEPRPSATLKQAVKTIRCSFIIEPGDLLLLDTSWHEVSLRYYYVLLSLVSVRKACDKYEPVKLRSLQTGFWKVTLVWQCFAPSKISRRLVVVFVE